MLLFLKRLLWISGLFCLLFAIIFFGTATNGINKSNENNVKEISKQSENTYETLPSNSLNYNSETYSITDVESRNANTYSDANATETVTVERVVDGDTFVYIDKHGAEQRLRLIGIDTPESVNNDETKNCKYGKVASKYTTQLLTNKTVSLEFDEDKKDIYFRNLAYVYLDGVMVNYDLVAKGYAIAKEYPPNTKYSTLFISAQIEAEKSKSGMWSDKVSSKDCNLKEEYYIEYN